MDIMAFHKYIHTRPHHYEFASWLHGGLWLQVQFYPILLYHYILAHQKHSLSLQQAYHWNLNNDSKQAFGEWPGIPMKL